MLDLEERGLIEKFKEEGKYNPHSMFISPNKQNLEKRRSKQILYPLNSF